MQEPRLMHDHGLKEELLEPQLTLKGKAEQL